MNKNLANKIKESLLSVLPVSIVVLLLHWTVAPLPGGTLGLFLVGMVLLIIGMALFTLGADMSMMVMGERVGAHLSQSRKLWLLLGVGLCIGFVITIAEPDLQVLAKQVPAVPDMTLILAVAAGVGLFLVVALLRVVFRLRLSLLLIACYAAAFLLAAFTSPDFLAVAFDSGGVTTGPITVPFILAFGVGVAAVRGGRDSHEDSFGMVALCSVGPILVVLLLGMFFDSSSGGYYNVVSYEASSVSEVFALFCQNLPHYAKEVAVALAPILCFFVLFQLLSLKLAKDQLIKMIVGAAYTYVGLVLFLTGVNIGFMPTGTALGEKIGALPYRWILIPLGMVLGLLVVAAEPAVHVLNKQVEEISGGTITKRMMLIALSLGVAVSIGLSMVRILTGTSIWWFLLGGYAAAIVLSFFVPRIYTAIAFDSGGVASGPMTATFLLPFAMGVCAAVGGDMLTDAFGIVAMVAMTPLVTIQLLGLVATLRARKKEEIPEDETDMDIIEI